MSEQGSPARWFGDAVGRKPDEPNMLVIDLSSDLTEDEKDKLEKIFEEERSRFAMRYAACPTDEQTDASSVISSSVNANAFQPGHVFTADELPKNKKHLIGALYLEDNTNGTMRVLSDNLFESGDTWYALKKEIDAINKDGNNVRIPTNNDFNTISNSSFAGHLSTPGLNSHNAIWGNGTGFRAPDIAGVYYPDNSSEGKHGQQYKSQKAQGHFVCDEPRFEPE